MRCNAPGNNPADGTELSDWIAAPFYLLATEENRADNELKSDAHVEEPIIVAVECRLVMRPMEKALKENCQTAGAD